MLWILLTFGFVMASCKDPGYLRKEYDLMHLLENFHPDDICPRCEVLTTPRSHHCSICDKCVERWDHHCPWINNCVGVRNHNFFFIQLISTCILLLLFIEPPITSFFLVRSGEEPSKIYSKMCIGCNLDYIYFPVYALQCLYAIIGFLITVWILQASFRKFARDGAQLAEEEEGTNSIKPEDEDLSAADLVQNRVGKT